MSNVKRFNFKFFSSKINAVAIFPAQRRGEMLSSRMTGAVIFFLRVR
jgi:hypothetical protein